MSGITPTILGQDGSRWVNAISTGNPGLGTKLLGISVGLGFEALKGLRWVNAISTGNPGLGTKLLGISIGLGFEALKG